MKIYINSISLKIKLMIISLLDEITDHCDSDHTKKTK